MVLSEKTNFTTCQCTTSLYYSEFYYTLPDNTDIQHRKLFFRAFCSPAAKGGKFGSKKVNMTQLSQHIVKWNSIINKRKKYRLGVYFIHLYYWFGGKHWKIRGISTVISHFWSKSSYIFIKKVKFQISIFAFSMLTLSVNIKWCHLDFFSMGNLAKLWTPDESSIWINNLCVLRYNI